MKEKELHGNAHAYRISLLTTIHNLKVNFLQLVMTFKWKIA